MRVLILLLVFSSFCSITFAQAQPIFPQKRADDYAKRNLTLERDALAQRQKLDGMMPPWAKQKLSSVSRAFLKRLLRDKTPADPSIILKEELGRQFVELTPQQSRILALYVLTSVIKLLPPHRNMYLESKAEEQAEKDRLKDKRDSLAEMSEQDMLMLQQMMEKKNQLETMISNVMKAGFEGGQAAIQALKAS